LSLAFLGLESFSNGESVKIFEVEHPLYKWVHFSNVIELSGAGSINPIEDGRTFLHAIIDGMTIGALNSSEYASIIFNVLIPKNIKDEIQEIAMQDFALNIRVLDSKDMAEAALADLQKTREAFGDEAVSQALRIKNDKDESFTFGKNTKPRSTT